MVCFVVFEVEHNLRHKVSVSRIEIPLICNESWSVLVHHTSRRCNVSGFHVSKTYSLKKKCVGIRVCAPLRDPIELISSVSLLWVLLHLLFKNLSEIMK